MAEFGRLFLRMLSMYDLGLIPVSLDRVSAGDFDRMRRRNIKHLIVLGCSDSRLPQAESQGGVFSSEERQRLLELDIGLAGIEVYDILRDEYDIQIEFGDIGNILAYLSIGDRIQEVERLVSALAEIRRRYQRDGTGLLSQEFIDPEVVTSPQEAFYAPKRSMPLVDSVGQVCSEFVTCYPPGIPILAPGERITREILEHIQYAKAKGCSMTGPEDPELKYINVLA